jgi:hypothetical protein
MIDKSKGILTYYDDFSRVRKIRPTVLAGLWVVFVGTFLVLLLGAHGI